MSKLYLALIFCVITFLAMASAVTPSLVGRVSNGDHSSEKPDISESGNKGCCTSVGMGNVDGSSDGLVTMGDLTVLIDHLFITLTPLTCPEAGNVDLSPDNLVTMGDLTVLIDHLFITLSPLPECPSGTVTDIDGNVYQIVTIGSQVWMVTNLKVTHYRNGEDIPNVTVNATWAGLTTGAYCEFNNDVNNVATYGRLYNWYAAVDSRNIAPAGWHVPTDAEWKQLEMYLGMTQAEADAVGWRGTDEGGKLKEAGTTHWDSPNTGATNESGFTALPGGYRDYGGACDYMGYLDLFWSSTEDDSYGAWYRSLHCYHSEVSRDYFNKPYGLSVRCVRDY
jgi:uncharacterized protein (TIGR02145 family)